ncbi:hypothetical protein PPERSA_02452 [Pseudocohnilembus persalinus]|uniref:Ribosomal RNA large subunit methyltransferase K/L-like methyltransferase domain-containing protein n=1 Tax=Pseudocohnilembus persalinus TaxID=266149 RepID=A0A0V0QAS2_PSEPJ|nr:hypothetical protein PPERSA_02452 [Pseudocohnilembus persalinus]|eukprot:KRW99340.1 hypothetical protein PPERSA_02452 [Pseudocohnilembus persalinus]
MNKPQNFKTYVCILKIIERHTDFPLCELKSLFQLKKIDMKKIFSKEINPENFPNQIHKIQSSLFKDYPLIKLYHDNEQQLKDICYRSVGVQHIFELISEGENYDQIYNDLDTKLDNYPQYFKNPEAKINIYIQGINKNISGEQIVNFGKQFFEKYKIQGNTILICQNIQYIIYSTFIGKPEIFNDDFKIFSTEVHTLNIDKAEHNKNVQKLNRLQQFLKNGGKIVPIKNDQGKYKKEQEDPSEEEKKKFEEELIQKLQQKSEKEKLHPKEQKKLEKMLRKREDLQELKKIADVPKEIEKLQEKIEDFQKNTLQKVFFGICKISSKNRTDRKTMFNYKFNLQDRAYLGPTSADYNLAFFMANQAQVEDGDMVFDPYVGTAGLLIPATYFGGFCYGTDIDSRVIHGYGVGRLNTQSQYVKDNLEKLKEFKPKIMINFEQYNLQKPEILRMDCFSTGFKSHGKFDAIITDPPYGIRATSRKSGKNQNIDEFEFISNENQDDQQELQQNKQQQQIKKSIQNDDQEESKDQIQNNEDKKNNQYDEHVSFQKDLKIRTVLTDLESQVKSLYNLAYNVLKPKGRLVYLLPVFRKQIEEIGHEKCIFQDERFQLVDYSVNELIGPFVRFLVTMEKKE